MPKPCERCGDVITSTSWRRNRFCSTWCAQASLGEARRALRNDPSSVAAKWERKDRERLAVGLGYGARRRLLKKWEQQRRSCAYCPAPATTVDHVIPLARGGTNYEGNLVPACKRCNSAKCDRLVVEWRWGRPAGYTRMRLLTREPRARVTPEPTQLAIFMCWCGSLFTSTSTTQRHCSRRCSTEWNARRARERYRARAGLPATWDVPTAIRVPRAS